MNIAGGYHLILSVSHQAWHVAQWQRSRLCYEAEHAFESFDALSLTQVLRQAPLRWFQAYTLKVSVDFCTQQTILLDASWQGQETKLAFIEEVQAELAHDLHDLDDYFIDARALQCSAEGLEVQVWLLSKTKIAGYLKAAQARRLRLQAIYIEAQGLNLFPWRQHEAQQSQRALYGRMGLPSLLIFVLALGWFCYENSVLTTQKKMALRLHKQEAQYLEANPDAFSLSDALPLLDHLAGVDTLNINSAGEVEVAGFALQSTAVSPQLQTFGEQSALQKTALYDLKIHQEQGRTLWQARFQLRRSDS